MKVNRGLFAFKTRVFAREFLGEAKQRLHRAAYPLPVLSEGIGPFGLLKERLKECGLIEKILDRIAMRREAPGNRIDGIDNLCEERREIRGLARACCFDSRAELACETIIGQTFQRCT